MGGHPYRYVVDYDQDLQAALDRLRAEVFRRGEYYGADPKHKNPEAALKASGETGTRSILDITQVQAKPDYCRAAPLTREELIRYFGTEEPTLATVEDCEGFWEDLERGMARCVVVADGDAKKVLFAGYSFD
jgi:hypothetical protein